MAEIRTALRELDVRLSTEDVAAAIAPYVQREFERDSAAWREVVAAADARMAARRLPAKALMRRLRVAMSGGDERRWEWNRHWRRGARFRSELYRPDGEPRPYDWRDKGLMMSLAGGRRSRILYLMRVIEALQPASVLEVGFGDGLNLVTLANRFPAARFAGIELAESGFAAARALQQAGPLSQHLLALSPDPVADPAAFTRIDFRQANASRLPFADGAFDLVFTCVALEQMEALRDAALAEVHRVSGGWIALLEPFRDFNAAGLRLQHVTRRNYFAARVADLPSYGLRPLFVSDDMPQKLKLAAGLAVTRKAY